MPIKVSVIMPVFNGHATVRETVDSVFAQTFQDWELLIYDDASTDGTVEYLKGLEDRRVKLYVSESNHGYARWLNQGLIDAEGEYIARLDADDICLPDRFRQQVEAFEHNQDLVLAGCNSMWIDAEGHEIQPKIYPEHDVSIHWELLCDNPFCHPGVMMRGEVIRKHQLRYREDLLPSEDYEMWTQLLQYGQGMNVQQILLKYRVHEGQISNEKRALQLDHHDEVLAKELERWLSPIPARQVRVAMRQIWQGELIQGISSEVCLADVCSVINRLYQSFEQKYGTDVATQYAGKRNTEVWKRLFNKAGGIDKLRLLWAWLRSGVMFSSRGACS